MKLYLSYVAVSERESGEVGFLAQASHLTGGGDCAKVAHAHELIRGSTAEGFAMREKYSHALVVIDNVERAAYEFPDPKVEEQKRISLELDQARRVAATATASAEAAKKAAASAKAAAEETTEANERVKELEQQLATINGPKPEPQKGGAVGVLADLLKLDDAMLAKVGEDNKVTRKAEQSREDFASEIAKAAGYKV